MQSIFSKYQGQQGSFYHKYLKARVKQSDCFRARAFEGLPPEIIAVTAVIAGPLVGYLAWSAVNKIDQEVEKKITEVQAEQDMEPEEIRENAVMIFGATGTVGRLVVKQILSKGRSVVAAVRSKEKAIQIFSEMGLTVGPQPGGHLLSIEANVDITKPDTLTTRLARGIAQVVVVVGSARPQRGQEGQEVEMMTPQKVDANGVSNIAAWAKKTLSQVTFRSDLVIPTQSQQDIALWEQLDDRIMGGTSQSSLQSFEDEFGAQFSGTLVTEGGGFCSAKALLNEPLDMSAYDGVALAVKGDKGQKFKFGIRTQQISGQKSAWYQAMFQTQNTFSTVNIPWVEFVPVRRAKYAADLPSMDVSKITEVSIMLSRFGFNGAQNETAQAGDFTLDIMGGIQGYRQKRPRLVLLSTCGVERMAMYGDDMEQRKKDIPIVVLNPGGVLNHKYEGEMAVRQSGLPYSIVRSVAITPREAAGEETVLEMGQGDQWSGKISREEIVQVIETALSTPSACGKTFEVRRSDAAARLDNLRETTRRDFERMFSQLVPDGERVQSGLPPFPKVTPPPPPPSPELVAEIMGSIQVQNVQKRDQQEREQAKNIQNQIKTDQDGQQSKLSNGNSETKLQNGELQNGAKPKVAVEASNQ